MLTRRNLITAATVLAVAGANPLNATQEKETLGRRPDKLTLGKEQVEELLLLMDTDKNGKISKREWMAFMEAEFDRLDKDRSGELDIKEIAQSRLRATRHVNTGK
jgi:Ca2+-binding EF-hand superfamily protein